MGCEPCDPCGRNNVKKICGHWPEPQVRDKGCCFTRRVKLTCEAPEIPPEECPGNVVEVIYRPDLAPPFAIVIYLVDSECERITDSEGNFITTIITS